MGPPVFGVSALGHVEVSWARWRQGLGWAVWGLVEGSRFSQGLCGKGPSLGGPACGDPQGRLGALGLVSGPAVNPVCSCLGPWPHHLEATGPETGHGSPGPGGGA